MSSLLILVLFDSASQITSSPYSIFGLGSVEGTASGTSTALGGTGIAFLSDRSLNLQNPASLAGMDSLFTIFEIGFAGKYTQYSTSKTHQSLLDANFRYIALGFRVSPIWSTSFGITPYSTIGYNIHTQDEFGGSDQKYNKTYSGEGGVNKVFLGNAVKLTRNLFIGVNAVYLFGTVTHTESADDYYFSLRDETFISNFNLNYGLNYRISKNGWNYNIGLIYDNGKNLLTENETTISTATAKTTLESTNSKYKVPRSFGIGFAFEKDFLRGGVDFEHRNWKGIEFANPLLESRNSNRYSFGIEVPSLGVRRGSSKMIFYRIGAEYSESYMVIKGIPVNYRSVSFGTGIPARGILSIINLSVELGQNGTRQGGLFKESFCTIHFDISLKDIWFKRRMFM